MRQAEWEELGFTYVGDAAVDSGQIMIVDPAYVLGRTYGGKFQAPRGSINNTRPITYDGLMDHYTDNGWNHPHVEPWGKEFGFVSGTLHGDGCYPIYAIISGSRYAALTIDFDPATEYDDDEDWEDDGTDD